jgi:5'-deoxynucleotidase YfbR-like HD superfamily hydrolase
MMSDDTPIRLDTRLSGQLRRYHTWPIVGQQTVAEHCWNLLRIYLCVTDKIDHHMVMHIMYHDIGEIFTGDAPYPLKHNYKEVKALLDVLEIKSMIKQLNHWGAFKQIMLTEQDRILFKQIELIEMSEFGMDQVNLGNSHGFVIADRCLNAVYEQEPCARLIEYVKKRLGIFFLQIKFALLVPKLEDWWSIQKWDDKLNPKEETNANE